MASEWIKRLRRITSSGEFIPEIDGFRFVAITAVVVAHLAIAYLRNPARPHTDALAGLLLGCAERATYGVEFFFVISGFILALPFARHFLQGTPAVRIGRYYLRRLTRLEPPYILCLIGFYVLSYFLAESDMAQGEYAPSFLARLFYLHGLVFGDTPRLNGVTWSLEVEVQFYVLVPLLVLAFRLPAWPRRAIFLAIVLLAPWIHWQTRVTQISLTAFFHYFVAGFLLADLYLEVIRPRPVARIANDLLALAVFLGIWLWPVENGVRPKLLAFMIASFYFLAFRSVWFRRFFCHPWICVIGGMCYTIYLLHYPLIVAVDRVLWKVAPHLALLPGLLTLTVMVLPTLALVSLVFFTCIERPCMDSRWPSKLWSFLGNKLGFAKQRAPIQAGAQSCSSPPPNSAPPA